MIFVGDIASAEGTFPSATDLTRLLMRDERVIANLEGSITADTRLHIGNRVVFNHPAVVSYLSSARVGAVTLANNHVMDISGGLAATIAQLCDAGIGFVGAGMSFAAASGVCVLEDKSRTIALVAFGWDVIGCRTATAGSPGVNPLQTRHVITTIEHLKETMPGAAIVVLPHWNYELEAYPQPLHRELAFRSIDAGASAVVACHPHCVQGIEVYKGAPIVYSLGNWYFPHGVFFRGRLSFPSRTHRELAFQWCPSSNTAICHWFDYDPRSNELEFVASERLEASAAVRRLTPFAGMPAAEYRLWFRKNRVKRKLLPVYADPDATVSNSFRDLWVRVRQRMLNAAVQVGLKGGPK